MTNKHCDTCGKFPDIIYTCDTLLKHVCPECHWCDKSCHATQQVKHITNASRSGQCAHCGKQFARASGKQIYCGVPCRQKHAEERRRQRIS